MKKVSGIILLIFITPSFLAGCTGSFDYYEDKLYSEKIIIGNQTQNTNKRSILTRENALKKALDIFDKGFNISIDRSVYLEEVRLYKDNNTDSLRWKVTWFKPDEKIVYTCIFNSFNGEVLQITNTNANYRNISTHALTNEEISTIIKPLFDILSLDINDYEINVKNYNKIKEYENNFVMYSKDDVSILMVNRKNRDKSITMSINPSYRKITEFKVIGVE